MYAARNGKREKMGKISVIVEYSVCSSARIVIIRIGRRRSGCDRNRYIYT